MVGDPSLLMLLGALLMAGAMAGLLAGLLGVGGGIILVPALFLVFEQMGVDPSVRMHLAVGSSLGTILPTGVRSAVAHYRRGGLNLAAVRLLAAWIALGALLGAWLASLSSFSVLTGMFGILALVVAAKMFLEPAEATERDVHQGIPAAQGVGLGIGCLSAMLGIGGGTLSVPVLSRLGLTIQQAVGTSAAFGTVIALPGAIGFILTGQGQSALPPGSWGYVNWMAVLAVVPATVLMAPLGARLAHSMPRTALRRTFAGFLALAAAGMLWESFSAL